MSEENQLNHKIINNAITAYFLVFISGMFLFNKNNTYLNNTFVKSHTKTAILIHLNFILIYFIFTYLGIFNISILSYNLNFILTTILFLLNFGLLLYGGYNAHLGNTFKIGDIIHFGKNKEEFFEVKKVNIIEKDKITIILSLIPFFGFLVSPKLIENNIIKNTAKLNLYVSLFISFLYIIGHNDISNLFVLFYTIFVVFFSILLIIKNELLIINLYFLKMPLEIEKYLIITYYYLNFYFKKDSFIEFEKIKNSYEEKIKQEDIEKLEELKEKKDIKLNKYLIYFPILNLIFLFSLTSKYRYHIINGIYISILFIIFGLLSYFNYLGFKSNYQLLLFFMIFCGIGHLKYKLNYKMPFLFKFHLFLMKIFFISKDFSKKVKEKSKEENIVVMKVRNILEMEEKEDTNNKNSIIEEIKKDKNDFSNLF